MSFTFAATGALSITALDVLHPDELRGKKVVCVVSGSNNDIDRMQVSGRGII